MEYERIEKVQCASRWFLVEIWFLSSSRILIWTSMPFVMQAGIISPSKLRMKLLGPHHHRKKDGSNTNSSRTSPARLEDAEFVNSLLASKNDNLDDEEVLSLKPSSDAVLDRRHSGKSSYEPKEYGDTGRVKMQHFQKVGTGTSSTIHALRSMEDENLDYDSNASSSSFEFDKGESREQSCH
ncbi:hypothetical protein VNO80_30624 [Phaseolus coccineus]|uniref:Uncharacterized protein n=1 Tax=Phaseolus coccineus TaxID=3886 RepID=A0AAN9QDM7_PHACN